MQTKESYWWVWWNQCPSVVGLCRGIKRKWCFNRVFPQNVSFLPPPTVKNIFLVTDAMKLRTKQQTSIWTATSPRVPNWSHLYGGGYLKTFWFYFPLKKPPWCRWSGLWGCARPLFGDGVFCCGARVHPPGVDDLCWVTASIDCSCARWSPPVHSVWDWQLWSGAFSQHANGAAC